MLNRDLDGERELVLEWGDATPTRVLACETLTGTDLKAFNTLGGRDSPGLAVDCRRTTEGRAVRKLVAPTGDTPGAYCLGPGMPALLFGGATYPMEIIHKPEQITIIYELHNDVRLHLSGSRNMPPEADRLPGRNGYSAARWEGDTLVVETTKLVEQVDQRYPHSDRARRSSSDTSSPRVQAGNGCS